MLFGGKIEIEKMREGWVERYSGYAFLHLYFTPWWTVAERMVAVHKTPVFRTAFSTDLP